MELIIILAVAIGGMYLLTGKQRKQQKEAASFRANLAPGQYVMTGSGLFGTIVDVDDEAVVLETSPGVTSRWLRPAVAKLAELPVPADDDAVDELEEAYDADAYDDEAYDETDEAYDDEDELADEDAVLVEDELADDELVEDEDEDEDVEDEHVAEGAAPADETGTPDATSPAVDAEPGTEKPAPGEDAPRR